ncbi:unnamed protein product, partial [Vitis vinifera]
MTTIFPGHSVFSYPSCLTQKPSFLKASAKHLRLLIYGVLKF